MSLFRQSSILARCDACKLPFDPVYGGVCSSCNRLLCEGHMYGGLLTRLATYIGIRKPCVDCRSGKTVVKGGNK